MTVNEYATAISTLISSYRANELKYPLDKQHVLRWLGQFDKGVRAVIAEEMFHILSRNYIKEERIKKFLKKILKYLKSNNELENAIFLDLQRKGKSQDIFCDLIKQIYDEKYGHGCKIIKHFAEIKNHSVFVYVDDGIYSGGRAKEDIIPLVRQLPERSKLYIFYLVAYNNALNFYRKKIITEADQRHIEVTFCIGQEKNNIRNMQTANIDFIWPDLNTEYSDLVKKYEKRLQETGKANYLYDWQSYDEKKVGLFSNYNSRVIVEKAFLEYGIMIANRIKSPWYRPLGLTNTPSFGFGSVFVTDFNISNTCPLVLWWGTQDAFSDHSDAINNWYPLFPRRTNEMDYEKINECEKRFSLKQYTDILLTIYHLAEKEKSKRQRTDEIVHAGAISLYEIVESRRKSDLLQYMHGLDMDMIKVIQTVMYIGRDYPYPEYTEEELDYYTEKAVEEPGYIIPEKKIRVNNPDEVLFTWMHDLESTKGWNEKDIEINQIYQKGPLAKYLRRAFDILGII